MKFQLAVVACLVVICVQNSMAQVYGGGSCSFATSGVAACTSTANGFCALDTFATAGGPPLTSATATGKCVCFAGFSGSVCGTATATTTATAATNNALGVLAVGALAAYFISGAGSSGSGIGGSDLTGTDLLYLQQAQQVQG